MGTSGVGAAAGNGVGTESGWNLFAAELQAILRAHGAASLGLLDDRAGIHREKVRRLRRSLEVPKSFPVLNPEEMEAVIMAFHLTGDEVLRLRAAMLATAVETLLMDRINARDARAAAEQILPVITAALRAHRDDTAGIGAFTRGGGQPVMGQGQGQQERRGESDPMHADMDAALNTAVDAALAPALDLLDRATLDLNLSLYADASAERLQRAQAAREGYQAALLELTGVEADMRATPAWQTWQTWRAEAERGYRAAYERVADLDD